MSKEAGIDLTIYRDVGVPTVGLSIIARDDTLTADPDFYPTWRTRRRRDP